MQLALEIDLSAAHCKLKSLGKSTLDRVWPPEARCTLPVAVPQRAAGVSRNTIILAYEH